jgi:hypothetical protein
MVVCNVERFLAEAIESILDQTFRDFEFIIVDFGSTDGSQAIIRRYREKDQRIKFDIIPHCNLAEARTACCLRAQGKYLALLDADDLALPERLMRQVEYLESHPEIGVLGAAHYVIDQSGRRFGIEGHAANDGDIRNTLKNGCPFQPCTVTMRFAEFQAVKGYRRAFGGTDGSKAISYAEDYDLWLRLAERCRMAKLGEPLACYRIHTGQLGSQKLTQLSVGHCVARVSAALRSHGKPDLLDSVGSITPELLAELGITEAEVQNEVQSSYHNRVLTLLRADGPGSVLPLVKEMLGALAESKAVSDSVAAETCFAAARVYWRLGNLTDAGRAMTRAFVTRPAWVASLPWRAIRRVARKVA